MSGVSSVSETPAASTRCASPGLAPHKLQTRRMQAGDERIQQLNDSVHSLVQDEALGRHSLTTVENGYALTTVGNGYVGNGYEAEDGEGSSWSSLAPSGHPPSGSPVETAAEQRQAEDTTQQEVLLGLSTSLREHEEQDRNGAQPPGFAGVVQPRVESQREARAPHLDQFLVGPITATTPESPAIANNPIVVVLDSEAVLDSHEHLIFQAHQSIEEARNRCHQALANNSLESCLDSMGLVLIAQGKLIDALGCYREAIASAPQKDESSTCVATTSDVQVRENQDECSSRLMAATSYNATGEELVSRGNLVEALACFRQALLIQREATPNSLAVATSLENIGSVMDAQGNADEALDCYHQALEINEREAPESLTVASSLNNVGSLLVGRGASEDALGYFQRAVEITEREAPETLEVAISYHNIAGLLRKTGARDEARKTWQKCDEALAHANNASLATWHPNIIDCKYRLGVLDLEDKQYDDALRYANYMIEHLKEYKWAHTLKAQALEGLNLLEEALEVYDGALAMTSNYGDAHAARFDLLLKMAKRKARSDLDDMLASAYKIIREEVDPSAMDHVDEIVFTRFKSTCESDMLTDDSDSKKGDYAEEFPITITTVADLPPELQEPRRKQETDSPDTPLALLSEFRKEPPRLVKLTKSMRKIDLPKNVFQDKETLIEYIDQRIKEEIKHENAPLVSRLDLIKEDTAQIREDTKEILCAFDRQYRVQIEALCGRSDNMRRLIQAYQMVNEETDNVAENGDLHETLLRLEEKLLSNQTKLSDVCGMLQINRDIMLSVKSNLTRSQVMLSFLATGETIPCPKLILLCPHEDEHKIRIVYNRFRRRLRIKNWIKRRWEIRFLCQRTLTVVNPYDPMVIELDRLWLRKLAPILQASFIAIKVASFVAGIPLPFGSHDLQENMTAFSNMFRDVMDDYTFDVIRSMERLATEKVKEQDWANNYSEEVLRLKRLTGAAHRAFSKEACKDENRRCWEPYMEVQADLETGTVIWVAK